MQTHHGAFVYFCRIWQPVVYRSSLMFLQMWEVGSTYAARAYLARDAQTSTKIWDEREKKRPRHGGGGEGGGGDMKLFLRDDRRTIGARAGDDTVQSYRTVCGATRVRYSDLLHLFTRCPSRTRESWHNGIFVIARCNDNYWNYSDYIWFGLINRSLWQISPLVNSNHTNDRWLHYEICNYILRDWMRAQRFDSNFSFTSIFKSLCGSETVSAPRENVYPASEMPEEKENPSGNNEIAIFT